MKNVLVRGIIRLNPDAEPIKVSDVLMEEPFEGFEVTAYGSGEVYVKLWVRDYLDHWGMDVKAVHNCANPIINRLALHGIKCTVAQTEVSLLEEAIDLTVVVEVSRPEYFPLTAFTTGGMKCVDMVELNMAVDKEIRGALDVFREQFPNAEEIRWEYKEHGQGHYIPVPQESTPVPHIEDYGLWVGHCTVEGDTAVSPWDYVCETFEMGDGMDKEDAYKFLREFYTEETTQDFMRQVDWDE